MTSALKNVLRIETQAAVAALAVGAWFFARSPATDYALLSVSAIAALVFVVMAVRRRRLDRVAASVAVWVLVYGFMFYAGRTAREDALASMAEVAKNDTCVDVACLKASGLDVVRIGANDGYLVERLGASVFVTFKAKDGTCRLTSDYMLGGSGVTRWACGASSNASSTSNVGDGFEAG